MYQALNLVLEKDRQQARRAPAVLLMTRGQSGGCQDKKLITFDAENYLIFVQWPNKKVLK